MRSTSRCICALGAVGTKYNRRLYGPQGRLRPFGDEKTVLPMPGMEQRFLVCPDRGLFHYIAVDLSPSRQSKAPRLGHLG